MEAAAKRLRRGGGGGGSAPDLLSALSDDLLRRVLSFLPSQSAVQTCVLSKRWIHLWCSVPAVQLDICSFRCGADRWTRMQDFATEFLMRQNTERLDVFRLVVDPTCTTPADFQRWARCGINRQPLVLQICAGSMYWKDLWVSRLSSAFRRLKRMELSRLFLDHSFTGTLNSGCPVLEDLVLDCCRHEFDVIQSDTLKNLSVRTFLCSVIPDALVIRAPCLAFLCLGFPYYHYKNGLSLEAGNSLARASISVVDGETSRRVQTILVGSLFNVTSLKLDGFSAMTILDKELDKFPTFDNLRTLSLNWCFLSERDVEKFKAIGRFLQKSPNLENLTLHNFWYFEVIERKCETSYQPRLEKVKPVVGPIEFPMLGNMTTLFLDECDLRDNFRILRHFLWSCPNLEKLTVRLCELPEASTGGKRSQGKRAKSKKTHSRFRNLVRIQCHNLKSTEIIYKKGAKIQELVSLLLDISESAPMNNITLTKYEEAMDSDLSD